MCGGRRRGKAGRSCRSLNLSHVKFPGENMGSAPAVASLETSLAAGCFHVKQSTNRIRKASWKLKGQSQVTWAYSAGPSTVTDRAFLEAGDARGGDPQLVLRGAARY